MEIIGIPGRILIVIRYIQERDSRADTGRRATIFHFSGDRKQVIQSWPITVHQGLAILVIPTN